MNETKAYLVFNIKNNLVLGEVSGNITFVYDNILVFAEFFNFSTFINLYLQFLILLLLTLLSIFSLIFLIFIFLTFLIVFKNPLRLYTIVFGMKINSPKILLKFFIYFQ